MMSGLYSFAIKKKWEGNMKLVESTYVIGNEGGLRIPAADLAEMGLMPGETVHIAFLSSDGQKNENREFAISGDSLVSQREDAAAGIGIPAELLQQGGIPEDADLQIICCDGFVIITRDATMSAEELTEVCESLRKAEEIVQQLPPELGIDELTEKLKEAVELAAERSAEE